MEERREVIRLLVVDDQPIFARCLTRTLAQYPDLCVVGTALDHEPALEQACALRPDVALVDIVLDTACGIDTGRELRRLVPGCRIIFLSTYIDPAYVLDALQLGAAGYLCKSQTFEELLDGVRRVAAGGRAFCAHATRIADALDLAVADDRPGARCALTPRQRQVLRLRARGEPLPAIARALGLQLTTVRTLWERALERLELRPAPKAGYIARMIASGYTGG